MRVSELWVYFKVELKDFFLFKIVCLLSLCKIRLNILPKVLSHKFSVVIKVKKITIFCVRLFATSITLFRHVKLLLFFFIFCYSFIHHGFGFEKFYWLQCLANFIFFSLFQRRKNRYFLYFATVRKHIFLILKWTRPTLTQVKHFSNAFCKYKNISNALNNQFHYYAHYIFST